MKNILHKAKTILIYSLALTALTSCSSEPFFERSEDNTQHVCKMVLNGSLSRFAEIGTVKNRAVSGDTWADKDQIFLSFVNGDERIDGKAVYSSQDNDWTLYYNGSIPAGTSSTCYASFFENDYTEANGNVTLNPQTATYQDANASYEKTSDLMKVKAELSPASGKIRFKGEKGTSINVSGVSHYTDYDIEKGTLESTLNPVSLSVSEDGFTPYIYTFFPSVTRELTIYYNSQSFKTACEHPILDNGQTGYMEIPTETAHNGWNLTKITTPTVAAVSVSDIGIAKVSFGSKVDNVGNGTITDCGFCYSTSPKPTVSDATVSYGATTASFGKTVTGLSENTTYYVRAYATNEAGTGYGDEISFKTLEVTIPSLSAVTLNYVSSTSVDFEAHVTSAGNGTLTEAGFVYSKEPYPTTSSTNLSCGKTTSLKSSATGLTPKTKYYVRAYAVNEKGTNYGEEKSFVAFLSAIDLGLSVKWASCNVGATEPEEYGGYYAWGETEGKKTYTQENYQYYNSDGNYVDLGSSISGTQYDVAHVKWGGSWRMPTKEEMIELCTKCTWQWITYHGIYGLSFKGSNGNSIFLPAAGCYSTGVYDQGSCGNYWSSTLHSNSYAYSLRFYDWYNSNDDWSRSMGLPVRPVTE